MTEAEFQSAVIELAMLTGSRVHHTRPAMNRAGRWSTPISGHPGYPDLTLIHPKSRMILFRELKSDRGRPAPEQTVWLEQLAAAGADAGIWRPRDWPTIVTTLDRARQ